MNIAIDLGSDRTRVFIEGKGKVLDEASVITYDVDSHEIFAVGDEAYSMIGKTPVGIRAAHPLDSGVIAQSDLVEKMVMVLFGEVCKVKIVNPRIVAAVPCELTEVEKRAVVNAVSACGARGVHLIETPKAAALGCGFDINSPHGVFIADLGAGTADIGVLSLGGISVSKSVKKAGSVMDDEIVKYIRKQYNLIIGTNMAEACKKAVGCVLVPAEQKTFRVKGRDAVSGLPRYVDVTSAEIKGAIEETAAEIVTAIRDVLEKTPPELISDIYTDGIFLTGGLAKLTGFAKLISDSTKLRVRVHKYAPDCVIMGCGKAIGFMDKPVAQGISPLMTAY
jgi:rod shape-determining protein MreB